MREPFQLLGVVWRSSHDGAVDDHELVVMGEWHNGPLDPVTTIAVHSKCICVRTPAYTITTTLGLWTNNQQTALPHGAIHPICHLACSEKTGIHP